MNKDKVCEFIAKASMKEVEDILNEIFACHRVFVKDYTKQYTDIFHVRILDNIESKEIIIDLEQQL